MCYQGDYIHPNHLGHQLIAGAMLNAWNLGKKINEVSLTFGRDRAKKGKVSDLRFETADTHFVWQTPPPVYTVVAEGEELGSFTHQSFDIWKV